MSPPSCDPLLPNKSDTLPRYRHAAPSGPWPWMDFSHVDVTSPSTAVATVATDASTAPHWSGYPQNLFGNWTPIQVERSNMLERCSNNESSTIYWMDVRGDGEFTADVTGGGHTSTVTTANPETFWEVLQPEVNLPCQLVSLIGWMMGFTETTKYPSTIIICGSHDKTCLENARHEVCATFCLSTSSHGPDAQIQHRTILLHFLR